MIKITKTPNADSRTTPAPMNVTIDELAQATAEHIGHVEQGMNFIAKQITNASKEHDYTKMKHLDDFYTTLTTCTPGDEVKASDWYKMHITEERHHLLANAPDDVNLIDVIEHLVDCVMAGMSRSGKIFDIDLPDELLQKAHKNTVDLLKNNIKIVDIEQED